MDRLFLFIATAAGSGYLPKAPGTWASALTALCWLLAASFIPLHTAPYLLFVAAVFFIGVAGAGAAEKLLDRPDPGLVVIDEVAGQLIALCAAPAHPLAALAGFILFRIFDIFKPFPVSWLDQHIHGGLGIMLDDVAAGLYALAVLQLSLYLLNAS